MSMKISNEYLDKLSAKEFHSFMCENYDFEWTEELIDEYPDKIDWNRLTYKYSDNIQWTTLLLDKHKDKIKWGDLSNYSFLFRNRELKKKGVEKLFTAENLIKFSEFWDWKSLSAGLNWTRELIEVCKDKIDWIELINRDYNDRESPNFVKKYYTISFYKKYEQYIPFSEFKKSKMCKQIINNNIDIYSGDFFRLIYAKSK